MGTTEEQLMGMVDSMFESSDSIEPEAIEDESADLVDDDGEEIELDDTEAEVDEDAEEGDEPDDDDDDLDDEDATEESEGDEEPQRFKVKVDGEEVDVTLEDLTRDYSGNAYIQKGMQEAAGKRKEAEAIYESLNDAQQQFLQVVEGLQAQGVKQKPQAPDASKMDIDPIGYMQDRARYDAELSEYNTQQQTIQQTKQQQTQMQAQARQAFLQEQQAKLHELIPEFADPEKAQALKGNIFKAGTEAYGFSADELSQVADARHIQVLVDAMRYRELQRGKADIKKKVTAPKNVKPKARRSQSEAVVRQKQVAKAKKTGSIEDFMPLMMKP